MPWRQSSGTVADSQTCPTIPPQLKYVTTVPCNLWLITALVCNCRSFSRKINVSQGSVATHMRCGGTFNTFLLNLLENLTVKILKIG